MELKLVRYRLAARQIDIGGGLYEMGGGNWNAMFNCALHSEPGWIDSPTFAISGQSQFLDWNLFSYFGFCWIYKGLL
jgi:hypothetical protein